MTSNQPTPSSNIFNTLHVTAACTNDGYLFIIASGDQINQIVMLATESKTVNFHKFKNEYIIVLPASEEIINLKFIYDNSEQTLCIYLNNISKDITNFLNKLSIEQKSYLLNNVKFCSTIWNHLLKLIHKNILFKRLLFNNFPFTKIDPYFEFLKNKVYILLQDIYTKWDNTNWISAIDGFDSIHFSGWAKKKNDNSAQRIDILVNNEPIICNYLANNFREDIKNAGFGDGCYSFNISIPSKFFDSDLLAIALRDSETGYIFDYHFYHFKYSCLDYKVEFDKILPILIGWAITPDQADRILDMEIMLNDVPYATFKNNLPRKDLHDKNITSGNGGFQLETPAYLLPQGKHNLKIQLTNGKIIKETSFIAPGKAPTPITDISFLKRRISIIIPHYNDPCIDDCLKSILEYTPEHIRIIIIDDCSTDKECLLLLKKYENHPLITIIRHSKNLRCSAAINTGLKAAENDDVIKLDSDARVTPGWLRSILITAASSPRVATVTPMSDRAGAFSAPEKGNDNPLPLHCSEASFARAFRRASFGLLPDVPTGHGFCMYISRACIDDIGMFDAETFSAVYGDETDFCMRALRAGWKHLVDDRTYVFHERARTFEQDRSELFKKAAALMDSLYPEYNNALILFRKNPKLKYARYAGKIAARNWRKLEKPRILYITATRTGGTPQTNMDLMCNIQENAQCYLLSCNAKKLEFYELNKNNLSLLYEHTLAEPIDPISHYSMEYDAVVGGWLFEMDIDLLHIRSLIWHSLGLVSTAKQLGCKIILSLHDFYIINPNLNLLDDIGNFLGDDFISKGSPYRADVWNKTIYGILPVHDPAWINAWQKKFQKLIPFCDSFVTTSLSVKKIFLKYFPNIPNEKFFIIPHGLDIKKNEIVKKQSSSGRKNKNFSSRQYILS